MILARVVLVVQSAVFVCAVSSRLVAARARTRQPQARSKGPTASRRF